MKINKNKLLCKDLFPSAFILLTGFSEMSYCFFQSAQFFKVTTENFHKAADEVNAKYR